MSFFIMKLHNKMVCSVSISSHNLTISNIFRQQFHHSHVYMTWQNAKKNTIMNVFLWKEKKKLTSVFIPFHLNWFDPIDTIIYTDYGLKMTFFSSFSHCSETNDFIASFASIFALHDAQSVLTIIIIKKITSRGSCHTQEQHRIPMQKRDFYMTLATLLGSIRMPNTINIAPGTRCVCYRPNSFLYSINIIIFFFDEHFHLHSVIYWHTCL